MVEKVRNRLRKIHDFRHDPEVERKQREMASVAELGINHIGLFQGLINGVFGGKRGLARSECEELWGFDLSGIGSGKFFSLHPQKESAPSMHWLVENLIIPQTIDDQIAFIEHFYGILYNEKPVVGVANVFHSYTWGETVKDTLNALDRNVIKDVKPIEAEVEVNEDREVESLFFWLDFFCQNQHVKGDIQANIFGAIKQCERFYASIPRLHSPKALGRVWCIFELGACVGESKVLNVITADMSAAELASVADRATESFFVDAKDAEATVASDKEVVLGFVESNCGGVDKVNKTVNDAIAMLIRPTILQEAAKVGVVSVVEKMIKLGVDVNEADIHGSTPLHHAATFYGQQGNPEMMHNKLETTRLLLENGADRSIEDAAGRKAFERAGSSEIGALLASFKQR